jgi:hypothetical protein
MIRSVCGGLSTVLLGVLSAVMCTVSALAADPRHSNDDAPGSSMHFALHRNFPRQFCSPGCRVLISASGSITARTPGDFEDFARGRDLRGATVVLNSNGGSVLGAIALGRAIRALGLATTVGRVRPVGSDTARQRVTVAPDGRCQSMCPFVLLGGVRRFVPPEATVRVHDIWIGNRRNDATAASYSAEDLMAIQQDVGRLVQYTLEMGDGADLLETALRIPPWEPLRPLSSEELRRSSIETQVQGTPAPAESAPSGLDRPTRTNDGGHDSAIGQAWTVAQRAGRPVLARRHLLTIEGEKVGTFELALSCGADNRAFAATYAEAREGANEPDPSSLAHVELRIAGRPVALDINPSPSTRQGQFEMLASGTVPAGLVMSFARADDTSMIVRTSSATRPDTAIRLGNSGFPQQFARLATACEMPQATDSAQIARVSAGSVR